MPCPPLPLYPFIFDRPPVPSFGLWLLLPLLCRGLCICFSNRPEIIAQSQAHAVIHSIHLRFRVKTSYIITYCISFYLGSNQVELSKRFWSGLAGGVCLSRDQLLFSWEKDLTLKDGEIINAQKYLQLRKQASLKSS